MEYIITVTESEAKALAIVAARDGITAQELVEKQLAYYLGNVIREYVERPTLLTAEEEKALNTELVNTKAAFIASIGK